jgi:hypothetical protein
MGVAGDDVDALGAWQHSLGAGVTIGEVDTGVDASNPDLAGQLVGGYNFVDGGVITEDENGHGTETAGIMVALQNNGVGGSGLAPEAKIMPLQVFGVSGTGSVKAVAAAFNYAGQHGLRVVNASLSLTEPSPAVETAIRSHPRTLYVVAAGNSGLDNDIDPEYPCAVTAANLLCVGALDGNNAVASFSNYGSSVSIYAPGSDIFSTTLTGSCEAGLPCGFAFNSGTSMAAPFVSATAALLLAENPLLSTAQLKADILDSAVHATGPGTVLALDAGAATVLAAQPPPTVTVNALSLSSASSAGLTFAVSGRVLSTTCVLDREHLPCPAAGGVLHLRGLVVGRHRFRVLAVGSGGTTAQQITWQMPRTPLRLLGVPNRRTDRNVITISYGLRSRTSSKAYCWLDKKPVVCGNARVNTVAFRSLALGRHRFAVRVGRRMVSTTWTTVLGWSDVKLVDVHGATVLYFVVDAPSDIVLTLVPTRQQVWDSKRVTIAVKDGENSVAIKHTFAGYGPSLPAGDYILVAQIRSLKTQTRSFRIRLQLP